MPGFVQYEGLPEYYGTAGAFILASTSEQWGLVVNEAMASGLPVLVSNRCGCAQTLVADGINGLTFDPFDRMAIAKALSIIAEHPALNQLGAASLERIADWGPERFAAGLSGAAHFALTNRQQQPSLFDKSILHAAALML
jgi:glycosyltransferase involved in cell wall biosynthesis